MTLTSCDAPSEPIRHDAYDDDSDELRNVLPLLALLERPSSMWESVRISGKLVAGTFYKFDCIDKDETIITYILK